MKVLLLLLLIYYTTAASINVSQFSSIQGRVANDLAGYSVALCNTRGIPGNLDIVIGAPQANSLRQTLAGIVYVVYNLTQPSSVDLSTLTAAQGYPIYGADPNDYAGYSVACADVNNDTLDDIIIGAPGYTNNVIDSGVVHVVYGTHVVRNSVNCDNITTDIGYTVHSRGTAGHTGSSLAVGDVNGDKIPDIIIGSPYEVYNNSGRVGVVDVVYSVAGKRSTVFLSNNTHGFVIHSTKYNNTGSAIAIGDVNGDHINDLVVGVKYTEPDATGCAIVLYGGFTGNINLDDSIYGFIIHGDAPESLTGSSVSTGDLDHDGTADVLVGSPHAHVYDRLLSGRVTVVRGKTGSVRSDVYLNNLSSTDGFLVAGPAEDTLAGCSVASGDINEDGVLDLLLGMCAFDPNGYEADGGAVAVVYGPVVADVDLLNMDNNVGFIINGPNVGSTFGKSIATARHHNGTYVLAGCPGDSPFMKPSAGAGYIIDPPLCTVPYFAPNGYDNVVCGPHSCTATCGIGFNGTVVPPVCKKFNTWKDVSGCSLLNCGPLTLPTGYVLASECTSTTYGSNCAIACDDGYRGTPPDTECMADGNWLTPTNCTIVDCGRYTPPAGYMKPSFCTTTFNSSCELQCEQGYNGSASAVVCQNDGSWSLANGCSIVTCGVYDPPAGYSKLEICAFDTYGMTCNLECSDGYKGHASNVACQIDGTWSTPLGCARLDCGSYNCPAGYTASCNSTTYGSSCTLKCASGYTGTANTVACGVDESWSEAAGCSPVSCSQYEMPKHYTDLKCTGDTYGQHCTMKCGAGYEGIGSRVQCEADGSWSEPTGCTRNTSTWIILAVIGSSLTIGAALLFTFGRKRARKVDLLIVEEEPMTSGVAV